MINNDKECYMHCSNHNILIIIKFILSVTLVYINYKIYLKIVSVVDCFDCSEKQALDL